MTHEPRDSAELEQTMLEHFRRHSEQTPPPDMDARILAAAQAQAAHYKRVPAKQPVLSRLQGWLFGGSQRARWSMAFASIATLGIGVGLATRTMERAPEQQYDAAPITLSTPAPAPAMAPNAEAVDPDAFYAAEPQAEKKASVQERAAARPEMRKQAPAVISGQLNEQLSDTQEAPVSPAAPFVDAAPKPSAPVLARKTAGDDAQVQRSLEQILQLQRDGQSALAEQQLQALQQRYPQRNVRTQLQQLQQSRGQQ